MYMVSIYKSKTYYKNRIIKLLFSLLLVVSFIVGGPWGIKTAKASEQRNFTMIKKYPKEYKEISKALKATDSSIYLNFTKKFQKDHSRKLIRELLLVSENQYYVKSWLTYADGEIRFNYYYSKKEIQRRNKLVNQKVDKLVKSFRKKGSDYAKVKAVHDYLVLNTRYDQKNWIKNTIPISSHSEYGALVLGVAVCDGYTRATQILLNKLGIENKYISGTVNGDGHAWNLVKINKRWYHMDVTFDDPVPNKKGYVGYEYFLKDSKQMSKDHKWDKNFYPEANKIYKRSK